MVKDIDLEDRGILEAQLKKYRDAPDTKQVSNKTVDDPKKRPDIKSKQAEVESLIDEYNNIITLANEIGTIIEQRSKDVKVTFNPDQDVTLRDSIRRLFGLDTDIVTYAMYKRCLELREELAKEDRESMRNL